jgi:hypothetical protein
MQSSQKLPVKNPHFWQKPARNVPANFLTRRFTATGLQLFSALGVLFDKE